MTKYFTKDHEWITVEGDTATIGITNYAQEQLGDVVFVDLPQIGDAFGAGDDASVIESVKAASDIYAPLTGEIVEINEALESNPSLINEDAEDTAWIFKMKMTDPAELDDTLDEDSYKELI